MKTIKRALITFALMYVAIYALSFYADYRLAKDVVKVESEAEIVCYNGREAHVYQNVTRVYSLTSAGIFFQADGTDRFTSAQCEIRGDVEPEYVEREDRPFMSNEEFRAYLEDR